ncbi:MAG TPA: winged helix-turn-helix transcriptional regulator [Symbiobacteriaceae bacterium]|nr:winged helix-turn-helix transcriptional regulator [Symbiobacteriaceae bacterium]
MELRPSDRHFLRDANIVAVASAIRKHQPISRVDLADITGLGRSTITTIVNTLLDSGLVCETGEAESAGRCRSTAQC